MKSTWESRIESAMPARRYRWGWMRWVSWGTIGTALTLQDAGEHVQVLTSFWLTAPFWIAFVVWPIFVVWRKVHDQKLAVKEIEAFAVPSISLSMSYLRERGGVTIPEGLLVDYVAESQSDWAQFKLPDTDIPARPEAGIEEPVWKLETLEKWADGVNEQETFTPILELRTWIRALAHAERFS